MQRKCSRHWDVLIVEAGSSSVGRQIESRLSRHGLRVCSIDNIRKLNERDFIKEIKQKAEETGIKMIIPVFYPEIISRHREEFPGILIPTDDAAKLEFLDNKLSACRFAEKLGILQPRIYEDPDSIDRYPVVFKRVSGHGGDSVYFPKLRKSLENLIESSRSGSYVITEEIEGDDISVDALRWDGFFFAGAYKVILPKTKGISILRESIDAPELVRIAQRILDAVDYKGVCGLDFRLGRDGKAYFLECNPRFSGGLRSQTSSGFDIPWLLWQLANGLAPDTPELKPGIRTQYIKGTADYLKRRRKQGKLRPVDIIHCVFSGARHFD